MVKETLSNLLLKSRNVRIEELHYDCSASAAQRLREDFYSGRSYDTIDLRIVLGSQTRGIYASASPEEWAKQFLEYAKEEREFRASLDKTREYRMRKREENNSC